MKFIVCLICGVLIGYLLLRLLADTVGFPAAWPIFGAAVVALGVVSFMWERRSNR